MTRFDDDKYVRPISGVVLLAEIFLAVIAISADTVHTSSTTDRDHLTFSYLCSQIAMPQSRARKALIVGAGPVGALTALSLHRRGWEVEVWESRDGRSPIFCPLDDIKMEANGIHRSSRSRCCSE